MNEITLKMNGRNPKKADYQGASYHGRTDGQTNGRTDGRTNGRTNEQTYFFLPFPKTKPLVPRGNNSRVGNYGSRDLVSRNRF